MLHCCIHNGLRLLHPFMPFVTEELFQRLQLLLGEPRSTVMLAPYPEPRACAAWSNLRAEAAMSVVTRLAASIRSLRGLYLKCLPANTIFSPMQFTCRNLEQHVVLGTVVFLLGGAYLG